MGVNRNTVNSWYNDFRHKIMISVLAETRSECGEFEVDESYFGAHRVRGKRGRGAAGKTPVFGLLKRGGKVIVRSCYPAAHLIFDHLILARKSRVGHISPLLPWPQIVPPSCAVQSQ